MADSWTKMTDKHTVSNILRFQATNIPDKAAFVFRAPNSNERHVLTYRDLYQLGGRWAGALHEKGLGRGDILVNALPNSPESAVVEVAVLLSGAASVDGVYQQKDAADLVERVNQSRAAALVVDPDAMGDTWTALSSHFKWLGDDEMVTSDSMPDLKFVFLVQRRTAEEIDRSEEKERFSANSRNENASMSTEFIQARKHHLARDFIQSVRQIPEDKHYHAESDMEDVCKVFATSGSSGTPKLVVFQHDIYTSISETFDALRGVDEMEYNNGQFGWVSSVVANIIMAGKTRILCDARAGTPDNMADFIFRSIVEEKPSSAFIPVAYLQDVADVYNQSDKREPLVDVLRVGTQPITKQIVQIGFSLAPKVTVVGYGMTELLILASMKIQDPDSYADYCVGNLFPGVDIKIRDQDGHDVEVGSRGEIHVKTPYAFSGYLHDPDATSAAYTQDGYFRTGDLGWFDHNKLLYTEGRQLDAFPHGGHVIYPSAMESHIRQCPGVSQAIVVGVPHPLLINELCACVVTKSPDVTMQDVQTFIEKDIVLDGEATLIAKPSFYLHFDAFPLTTTEKYDRKQVRKMAIERLGKSS